MDAQRLENLCQELEIPHCRYFDQVGSTNDVAMGWINEDYQEYALAIAGSQTKGRGRYDRQWITTPGASIAMSFIIHPTLPEREHIGLFPLLSGLALCTALESAYSLTPQVKWPNDILLAGNKTAGILVESVWYGDQLKGLVAGIGVNLLPDAVPQDIDFLFPATCVQDHSPLKINTYTIIQETIRAFKILRIDLLSPSFIDHYTQNLAYRDKMVELLTASDSSVCGYLKGIAEDGGLLLRTRDNTVTKYPVGDLRLRPKE